MAFGRALQVVTLTFLKQWTRPKEISGNHISYMKSLGFKEDNLSDKFPSFYWTPKLHITPYKHRFIWPGTTSSDTYIPETMDPKEISGNHISYMKSLGFKEDNLSDKLPSFYWTPKLHITPYKHRFIASSFDCTAKPLSVLLNRILSAIKGKLSNQSSVIYSHTGINKMWALKIPLNCCRE